MTKLDCDVVNCSYNKDASCVRQNIEVEGIGARFSSETCCASFAQKGDGCGGSNASGSFAKDTDVYCDASKCKFNENRKCKANHIGISGMHADNKKETECASFIS